MVTKEVFIRSVDALQLMDEAGTTPEAVYPRDRDQASNRARTRLTRGWGTGWQNCPVEDLSNECQTLRFATDLPDDSS